MHVLNEMQIKHGYFRDIGGFPDQKIVHELCEYDHSGHVCVACTQLPGAEEKLLFPSAKSYTEKEKKRILKEWISFLSTDTTALTAIHFNSRVPQVLFDAVCNQENLEELRFKWGNYSDLSKLINLKPKLKYLYVGQSSNVQDISAIAKLDSLVVLHIGAFKKVEDFSPLVSLQNLEQLIIEGPILGVTPIRDLDFLRNMPNLRSVRLINTKCIKKYSRDEFLHLRASVPNLYDMYGSVFGKKLEKND